MLGALRTKLPSGAPYVDFLDIAEFVAFCSATEARYVCLIERVVDSHMQRRLSKSRFAWTETDEMYIGYRLYIYINIYMHIYILYIYIYTFISTYT